jgi:hypothetical protein
MGLDLANLPTDTATLHEIIAARAGEAELTAAKAGLMTKALELEKLRAADRLASATAARAFVGEDRAYDRAARAEAGGAGGRDAGAGRKRRNCGCDCGGIDRRAIIVVAGAGETGPPVATRASAVARGRSSAELRLPGLWWRDAQSG